MTPGYSAKRSEAYNPADAPGDYNPSATVRIGFLRPVD
jgi:hypothetical protein